MTKGEIAAFNLGVQTMIDLATASAEALKERLAERPTRYNFSIGALEGLAEAGSNLIQNPLAKSEV